MSRHYSLMVCLVVLMALVASCSSVQAEDASHTGEVAAQSNTGVQTQHPTSVPTTAPLVVEPSDIQEEITPLPVPTSTPSPREVDFQSGVVFAAGPSIATQLQQLLGVPLKNCQTPGVIQREAIQDGESESLTRSIAAQEVIEVTCISSGSVAPLEVQPPAAGRIAHIYNQDPQRLVDDTNGWSWARQSLQGKTVVIDHGQLGEFSNVQTVMSGFSEIVEGLELGEQVDIGDDLGTIDAGYNLKYSIWLDGVRHDGVSGLVPQAPDYNTQLNVATALGSVIASPVDERCPILFYDGSLPGAPRNYRNGIHRGIDFNCAQPNRDAVSITEGTVIYLVNDYRDAQTQNRNQLLATAGQAQITPHWTLAMLYGNVVMIDHGYINGAGHLVSLYAHLEEVDPTITLGSRVTKGQRIGEIGNRGTDAATRGIFGANDPSLHLHWELYVDGWFVGQGLTAPQVRDVIRAELCTNNQTAGC